MSFEVKAIAAAHKKVKSGADFSSYIEEIKQLGVIRYHCFVENGHQVYFGEADFEAKSKPKYANLIVANISDKDRFKHYLRNHQRGQTDYPTFCKQAAETGVDKWTVDLTQMTCTYFDKQGKAMITEVIPAV
ncbi:MAG: hypothetical protein RLY16_619 [Bacteroidota bacterium]|jgi:uncharacterized protein YbcV (DUF1398 family)